MPPFLLPFVLLATLLRDLGELFRDPRYRAVLFWLAVLMATGTFFYMQVEGWSLLDSFYFTVVTLATVGYGDLAPTTSAGKIFTIIFIFLGLSFFITFINLLAQERTGLYFKRQRKRLGIEVQDGQVDEPS